MNDAFRIGRGCRHGSAGIDGAAIFGRSAIRPAILLDEDAARGDDHPHRSA
jgi:hypothetical protein